MCLAIIPARAGSKGIKDKNIKKINGQELIAYSIISAQKSKAISRIIVSTDGENIAEVALKYGAEVVFRPEELAQDKSSSEDAIIYTLNKLSEKEKLPENTFMIQCTSPLTNAEDFDLAVEVMKKEKADCVIPMTDFHYFLWTYDQDGNAEGINHNIYPRLLRQERKNQFLETGAFYLFNTQGFLKNKFRFFGKIEYYFMPKERVFEIDEVEDLLICENIIKQRND